MLFLLNIINGLYQWRIRAIILEDGSTNDVGIIIVKFIVIFCGFAGEGFSRIIYYLFFTSLIFRIRVRVICIPTENPKFLSKGCSKFTKY